jgi:hypothetical protein
MAQSTRPQLVSPRAVQTLEAVRTVTGGTFDADVFHIIDQRDNALIADEVLHGAGSSSFVYRFEIQGKEVTGISVIGARHLANHYQGLKHRIVASEEKRGATIEFKAYPHQTSPGGKHVNIVPELADEEDYYTVVCEVTDVKTGNSIQTERREARVEYRRDGTPYTRPNYSTIAQSKAYRNAVLALIPQDVAIRWKADMLKLNKGETITVSVLEEKRANVIRFAAQKALQLDRRAVEALTLDQISGLGDAAREGRLPAFVEAAKALGLEIAQGAPAEPAEPPQQQQQTTSSPPAGDRRRRRREEPAGTAGSGPPGPEHGGRGTRPGGRVDFEA